MFEVNEHPMVEFVFQNLLINKYGPLKRIMETSKKITIYVSSCLKKKGDCMTDYFEIYSQNDGLSSVLQ